LNIILDSDGDGISDDIEVLIGLDPNNRQDVQFIEINHSYFYFIDTNNDGNYDSLYNPTGRITNIGILDDGRLLLDVYLGTDWDYYYNPLTSEITPYNEYKNSSDEFPWIYLIIIITIILVILIIFLLFKFGYLRIEEYYE
jgi:hypothetical protein